MGDIGDVFNAMKAERKEKRAKYGVKCPECIRLLPKAHPSILVPNQKCKLHKYRDPRPISVMAESKSQFKRLEAQSKTIYDPCDICGEESPLDNGICKPCKDTHNIKDEVQDESI